MRLFDQGIAEGCLNREDQGGVEVIEGSLPCRDANVRTWRCFARALDCPSDLLDT